MPGDDREVEEAEAALEEAREDLDSWLADTKLRGILGPDRYADATTDRVAVMNKAEADPEGARERPGGRYELVARLSRMVRSVVVSRGREQLSRRVVSRGREQLSRRVEIELR